MTVKAMWRFRANVAELLADPAGVPPRRHQGWPAGAMTTNYLLTCKEVSVRRRELVKPDSLRPLDGFQNTSGLTGSHRKPSRPIPARSQDPQLMQADEAMRSWPRWDGRDARPPHHLRRAPPARPMPARALPDPSSPGMHSPSPPWCVTGTWWTCYTRISHECPPIRPRMRAVRAPVPGPPQVEVT
jgi:hypothetical protein